MSADRAFEFQVPPDAEAGRLMAEARARAGAAGIRIEGDATEGTFSGLAQGRYRIADGTVRVEVEKKPAFVPWSAIEAGLRRLFHT